MPDDDELKQLMGTSLHGDRFVISGMLGTGSQGDTLEAVDKREGCAVAVKRFQVRGARSWKDVELAEREARVLSGLEHRLLPRALAHFEQDGALYLVMDKIEGPTLRELGRMSRDEVVAFLHDAAEVLDYLHSRVPPVIHRDIKPGNIIARPPRPEHGERRPSYVLVDFGSVRDQLRPAGGSTVVGTYGYMAPEQFQGRARPASDVYAVGASALRMLTGQEPENLPHQGLALDVDTALGRGADPALRKVLRAVLEPDPDKRPSSLRPLLAQLQPAAAPPLRDPGRTRQVHSSRKHRKQQKRERREHERARRRAEKAQRKAARRARRHRGVRTDAWPPLFRFVAMMGLSIAQLAVTLSLGVAVPLLLTLLSIAFGPKLRDAAKQVRGAGRDARAALRRARDRVRGRLPASPAVSEQTHAPRQRIEVEPPQARVRVEGAERDQRAVAEAFVEAEQEAEAAIDEVVHEVQVGMRARD